MAVAANDDRTAMNRGPPQLLLAKWRWLQNGRQPLQGAQTLLFVCPQLYGVDICGATSCDYTTAGTTLAIEYDEGRCVRAAQNLS